MGTFDSVAREHVLKALGEYDNDTPGRSRVSSTDAETPSQP